MLCHYENSHGLKKPKKIDIFSEMVKEIRIFSYQQNIIFTASFLCVEEIVGTCSQKCKSFTCVLN